MRHRAALIILSRLTGRNSSFAKNPDKVEATSTNSDIYIVASTGGAPRNITSAIAVTMLLPSTPMTANRSSIDRRRRKAFEADRWRLMRYDRASGASSEITRGFDLQVDDFVFSPDGNTIYFVAGERGRSPIFESQRRAARLPRLWITFPRRPQHHVRRPHICLFA